jgi:hypothetical protein
LLEFGQSEMGGIWLNAVRQELASPEIIELVYSFRVLYKGVRSCDVFDSDLGPDSVLVAEGFETGFARNPGSSEDHNVTTGTISQSHKSTDFSDWVSLVAILFHTDRTGKFILNAWLHSANRELQTESSVKGDQLVRREESHGGRDRDRTDDLYRVKVALVPTELRALNWANILKGVKSVNELVLSASKSQARRQ